MSTKSLFEVASILAIFPGAYAQDVASKFYKVRGIPTQYILDRKGKVVKAIVGYSDDDSELTKAVQTALARK